MNWKERPIGIDLGTTNSATALLANDSASLILAEDEHGRAVIPSAVGLDGDNVVTGYTAWNRRGIDPEPIVSVKRKMGRSEPIELGSLSMTPAEVSAHILEGQVHNIRSYLERLGVQNQRVERAVVTVPAYFDAPQIEATKRAGEIAGLDVLALLQEPTAACMYYVWKREVPDGNFLVYDLGGGTFDVSIIRSLHGEYQVLGIGGDNYLGGDDFDRRLAEHMRHKLTQKGYRLDLDIQRNKDDAVRFLLLTRLARSVKEALSFQENQYIAQRDIFKDLDGKSVTLEMEFSRRDWETMMEDIVDSTLRCCERALEDSREKAGVELSDIDYVLLVGGSTRSPLVQRKVAAALCGDGRSNAAAPVMEAPDSCVALGAAIHAAARGGSRFGDDDAKIAVYVTSPLATVAAKTRLVGELAGEAAERVGTLVVADENNATLGIEAIDPDQRTFKVADIPLPRDGKHTLKLDLLSPAGATVAELPLDLYRVANLKATGSALTNPTVLAKDLLLEVQKDGQLERKVLFSRGRSLPAKQTFGLSTADQTGVVLLTLLQNRFPISSIHLEIPKTTPVGTPVDLEIEVDETIKITTNGTVAGQTFWAEIQAPEAAPLKEWDEIRELMDEAEQLGRTLWGDQGRLFQRHVPFLLGSIQEAARTDPDKLVVLVERLESNMDYFRGEKGELTPGMGWFRRTLDSIRRIAFRERAVMGVPMDEWKVRIDELADEGERAFANKSQNDWSRANTRAQALLESLEQDEDRFVVTGGEEHIRSLYAAASYRALHIRRRAEDIVLPKNRETAALRKRELDDILRALEENVEGPLAKMDGSIGSGPVARAALELIISHAKQLEKRLDELPRLGVVTFMD